MKTINPKIHLTDPNFKYIPSAQTDISKTFARIRNEQKFSAPNQDSKEPLVTRNSWGLPEIPPPKRLG